MNVQALEVEIKAILILQFIPVCNINYVKCCVLCVL